MPCNYFIIIIYVFVISLKIIENKNASIHHDRIGKIFSFLSIQGPNYSQTKYQFMIHKCKRPKCATISQRVFSVSKGQWQNGCSLSSKALYCTHLSVMLYKELSVCWFWWGGGGGCFSIITKWTMQIKIISRVQFAALSVNPDCIDSIIPFIPLSLNLSLFISMQNKGFFKQKLNKKLKSFIRKLLTIKTNYMGYGTPPPPHSSIFYAKKANEFATTLSVHQ